MKTKSVWTVASLAALCAVSHADEKAKEAAVKPAAASDYAPFVVPLPKDESGFATKPPQGDALKVFPVKPEMLEPRASANALSKLRFKPGDWLLNDTKLDSLFRVFESHYKVKIVLCFTPRELSENPKILGSLPGKTIEEVLNNLQTFGLTWRKAGDVYFVAWNESNLPPLQNAITPAPQ